MRAARIALTVLSFFVAAILSTLVLDWIGPALGIYSGTIIGEIYAAAKMIGSFAAGLWVAFKIGGWLNIVN